MVHRSLRGEAQGEGIVLGHFRDEPLVKRKAAAWHDASKVEIVAQISGDPCGRVFTRWAVSAPSSPLLASGVGGYFNPPAILEVEGVLAIDPKNVDGCQDFTRRMDGQIALVRRGNCWFHSKALKAQAAGAVATIIYNEDAQMIDIMEGVEELRPPSIPTVLVERSVSGQLRSLVGARVALVKADDIDPQQPITTSVAFRCEDGWSERTEMCIPGDDVDVRIVFGDIGSVESRWPSPSVTVQRATVLQVHRANGTLEVAWAPGSAAFQAREEKPLPSVVPSHMAFHGGVPCNSQGVASIVEVVGPRACHSEIQVHAPALCAHPRLLPKQETPAQFIECRPGDTTAQLSNVRDLRKQDNT